IKKKIHKQILNFYFPNSAQLLLEFRSLAGSEQSLFPCWISSIGFNQHLETLEAVEVHAFASTRISLPTTLFIHLTFPSPSRFSMNKGTNHKTVVKRTSKSCHYYLSHAKQTRVCGNIRVVLSASGGKSAQEAQQE
ncbi:hypothetical protein EJ110_NYTH48319, partial [Nymphaea thermarum]